MKVRIVDIGEKIKKLRIEQGFTQEDLAQAAKTTKQTIHKYENGIIQNIPASKIKALSDKLHTTPSFLMGWDERLKEPTITDNVVTFPVLGTIAAGYDEMALEDWSGDTVEIPVSYLKGRPQSDFFVLSVHGNSMYPLYHDGDKVLILKQSSLDNSGQIGAIIYDDECATLKKIEFIQGEDWLRMIPINPEFVPKTITGVDLEHCRVIGVPKFLIREIQ